MNEKDIVLEFSCFMDIPSRVTVKRLKVGEETIYSMLIERSGRVSLLRQYGTYTEARREFYQLIPNMQ